MHILKMSSNMKLIRPVAVTLLVLVVFCTSAIADNPVVNVKQGKIIGKRVQFEAKELDVLAQVDAYLSIPYAEAPVGPLRFKPPVPKIWSGDLEATELGNACPQEELEMWPLGGRPTGEDCLSLDVFVPVPRPSKAAVMVWIHGGAYVLGTGTFPGLEPYGMVALGEVIVVAINYRLGPLGFITTGDDEIKGNMGMLDQIEAMKWVQENIEAFGGDPDRVTIFGESAGAGSVSCHTLSPLSKGLFTRAIMQSGVASSNWGSNSDTENYAKRAFALGQLVNCTSENTKELAECLMEVSADDLASGVNRLPEVYPEDPAALPFAPVADGYFLPEAASTLIEKKLFNPVDIMVGYNADEGESTIIFFGATEVEKPSIDRTEFETAMAMNKITSAPLARVAMELVYFGEEIYNRDAESADYYDATNQILTDYPFACPSNAYLEAVSDAAGVGQVYQYYFTHDPSVSIFNTSWSGAVHAEELNFFGAHFIPDNGFDHTPEEVPLTESMIRYWTNFAKTGNPNIASEGDGGSTTESSELEWPQYTLADPVYRELSINMKTGRGLKAKQCTLWNDYLPKLEAETAAKEDKDQACSSSYTSEGQTGACTEDSEQP